MPYEDPSEPRDSLDFISSEKLESEGMRGYISWRSGRGEIARIVNEKELEIYGGGLVDLSLPPIKSPDLFGGKLVAELQEALMTSQADHRTRNLMSVRVA